MKSAQGLSIQVSDFSFSFWVEQDHKALALWSVLVGLIELDSNKCKSILSQKAKMFQEDPMFYPTLIISDEQESHNRKIDQFGEVAVKQLKQSYRKGFSDVEIDQIIFSYKSGKTTIEIAAQFGCCKNTINKLLRQHGVEVTREKAQAKLDAEKVIAMYAEMHTTAKIAEHFGVNSLSVIRCLRAHGVKIRSRWDYPSEK